MKTKVTGNADSWKGLEVIHVNLEEGLRMCTDGAKLRSLGAYNDVSAVAALPHLHFALLEDGGRLEMTSVGFTKNKWSFAGSLAIHRSIV